MIGTIRKVAFFTVLLLAAGGIACMSSQTAFLYKFSLKDLVERSKSIGGPNCSAGGGGDGIGVITGASGKGPSQFRKGETLSCQITDAEQFDEAKFIEALKTTVEEDLDTSKAKIVSSDNPEATEFYFEYALEDVKGRVQISGTRSGNYYSLNAELEEKTEAK